LPLPDSVFKKDYSWKTTFTLPVMKLQGDYSLFGRILLIPLNGRGQVFLDAGKSFLASPDIVYGVKLIGSSHRQHDCHYAHKDATL